MALNLVGRVLLWTAFWQICGAEIGPPQPLITPPPLLPENALKARDHSAFDCGSYYDSDGLPQTVHCGDTCYWVRLGTAAYPSCKSVHDVITTAFDLTATPPGGCGDHQLCCSSDAPYAGIITFNDAPSIQWDCDSTHFTLSGTSDPAVTLDSTSPAASTAAQTGSHASALASAPAASQPASGQFSGGEADGQGQGQGQPAGGRKAAETVPIWLALGFGVVIALLAGSFA